MPVSDLAEVFLKETLLFPINICLLRLLIQQIFLGMVSRFWGGGASSDNESGFILHEGFVSTKKMGF